MAVLRGMHSTGSQIPRVVIALQLCDELSSDFPVLFRIVSAMNASLFVM